MAKELSQSMIIKQLAGRLINLAGSGPGLNSIQCRLLGLLDGFVGRTGFSLRRTHVYGARHIRTIAREYNTEIADHESLRRDRCSRCAAMGQSRSLPTCDDGGKGHLLGACFPGSELDLTRELRFCDFGQQLRRQGTE